MREAYRIVRFHHVTDHKHSRLRQENLVPLSDESVSELNAIKSLQQGCWLIDYMDNQHPIFIMKFDRYMFDPHKHLYVKHFALVSHVFSAQAQNITGESLISIATASHMSALPLAVRMMLRKYENMILVEEAHAKAADKNAKKKHSPLRKRKTQKVYLYGKTKSYSSLNGPVITKSTSTKESTNIQVSQYK